MIGLTLYQLRVKGHLGSTWADWFGGLTIENLPNGESVLFGRLPDQAALYGVLNQIRDIGLTLISVNCVVDDSDKDERKPSQE